jgi:hypothetical protein
MNSPTPWFRHLLPPAVICDCCSYVLHSVAANAANAAKPASNAASNSEICEHIEISLQASILPISAKASAENCND